MGATTHFYRLQTHLILIIPVYRILVVLLRFKMKILERNADLVSRFVSQRLRKRASHKYKRLTSNDVEEECNGNFTFQRLKEKDCPTKESDPKRVQKKQSIQLHAANSPVKDDDSRPPDESVVVDVRTRRQAICEETERNIYNNRGISLRKFREFLVVNQVLMEMQLL